MDRDLAILREAALISMEERAQEQEEKELAALREAALDSARERKLSSDPLRKRRLETPPSHHYINTRSGDYHSCSDSDGSGNMTPKMSECDSAQHTPPRSDPIPNTVFTVKVTDNMLLKRNNSHRSDSYHSTASESFAPLIHPRKDNTITVKLTNDKKSLRDDTEDVSEEESEIEKVVSVDNPSIKDKSPVLSQRSASASQVSVVADVSPTFSKVSSADDSTVPLHNKKLKKKHKKKKSSTKHKKSKHQDISSSEYEKPAPKSNSNDHKTQKKQNGVSVKSDKAKTDPQFGKIEKNLKKQIINELDSKIDKNIELLQKAKRQKHENKTPRPVTKKIISEEISSNEEEELLKPDKKKPASPKHSKKDKSKKRKETERSPSPGPDISVSLKSKREFEQMKAEMNKKATKNVKKSESKSSPRKESKSSPRRESKSSPRRESKSSSKIEEKTSVTPKKEDRPPTKPEDDPPELTETTKIDDMQISELEELELLGEYMKCCDEKRSTETPNHGPETNISDDFVSVMKEDSFSDSNEEGDVVNITSDKKLGGESKKKKSRKSKKKKHKDEKKRKKKRKKRDTDSSSDLDSDGHENKKPKVKIDKSELNKIVQFLKQRDEAQKALDAVSASKTAFNPKIISKEAKPIEIKLKSKPKR